MDSKAMLADRLSIYLTAYKYYIETKSKVRLFDVAIFGESFACKVAGIVFDYDDLINLNLSTKNYPAIDLGSNAKRHAIQVTINGKSEKIEKTIETYLNNGLENKYQELRFIILGNKQKEYTSQNITQKNGAFKFNPEEDIYDLNDLYRIIVDKGDTKKMHDFIICIEEELGNKIRPYLVNYNKPAQNLRNLFEIHDVTMTSAVTALSPFGLTRKIYSAMDELNELIKPKLIDYLASQFGVSYEWLAGDVEHIYNNSRDIAPDTSWRRSLCLAMKFIIDIEKSGETLGVFLPSEVILEEVTALDNGVTFPAVANNRFIVFSEKINDLNVSCFRLRLIEPLYFTKTYHGLLLLFLAAEILEHNDKKKHYINIFNVELDKLLACEKGQMFIAEVKIDSNLFDNHKYLVRIENGTIHASNIPLSAKSFLEKTFEEFVKNNRHGYLNLDNLTFN
ncbi:SMEK domain-containing protein [Pantoea eucrina]|uniref:SMEK domain-containing protein n=1 Tax=Pantoea eucrina TaxID=472693 RepID=A0ABS1Z9J8_9GAMM|nr:SMEK domain-containing protein [Pantoea eucrina]MBM0748595.1 SMEK domain-containing protein [Pantoea eucrina]UBB12500.1 SMEK domain-containing protein [Pantoea eucrina]